MLTVDYIAIELAGEDYLVHVKGFHIKDIQQYFVQQTATLHEDTSSLVYLYA